MITLSIRSVVCNAAAVFSGIYGSVTAQARQAGCSRQTVYHHARLVEQRLQTPNLESPPAEVLAVRAAQAVKVEQTDEFVVAGVLVHEVGQGKIHGGVSSGSIGLNGMISQILEQSREEAHRFRLMSLS